MVNEQGQVSENLFCKLSVLDSEADVEALFVERLLVKLHYPDDRIQRKDSLSTLAIGKGSRKEQYKPDYVLLGEKKIPRVVVDAKSPSVIPENYHYQVSGYALALNQQHEHDNPVQFVIVSNGHKTLVYPWDTNKPCLELSFMDFEEDNEKFIQLRSLLTYGALEVIEATEDVFEFKRPEIDDLIRTFDRCHNLIWKKEKTGPTDAFYEFAKIMFVKMREDFRIAKMIAVGTKPKVTDFIFSLAWIREQVEKDIDDNPVANILFNRIRNELEEQIRLKKKKRIFLEGEALELKSSTVVEVVRELEHLDLHGIDEDLNGRMFETFLNATVRGKELGQFFTPRSAVKYMTFAAQLEIVGDTIPLTLDGCCGSAGFLIEVMAVLTHQIDCRTELTDRQRKELKKKLHTSCLWGADANERIARIARLNMYLHGDGGSKIFVMDTLDKALKPEKGWAKERSDELEELRRHLLEERVRFDA
ncbi:MAG: N-6 DNA methylase, partial [Armatimonadota bacterium]|nr:N-6 DNA methylase [Armatimonadota bacterium]